MVVNGVQCSGRYCDNMRLQCGRMAAGYRVSTSKRMEVAFFSEEQGLRHCQDGYFLRGMECSGRYCDNVKLYCALVEYNPSISPPPRPLDEDLAQRFAPQMYVDQSSS